MKIRTKIYDVMTKFPHSIGADQSIIVAKDMMKQYRIRHLPVQDGGRLVGIVSKRDIDIGLAFNDKLEIQDVCIPEPYSVEMSTPLAEVVAKMAQDSIGCALVTEHGKLIGIYTTVDACRTLAELLSHED